MDLLGLMSDFKESVMGPSEPGIPKEYEYDQLSAKLLDSLGVPDDGTPAYFAKLQVLDEIVRVARPDDPGFDMRFCEALLAGVFMGESRMTVMPSRYDIGRIGAAIVQATGTPLSAAFRDRFYPREVQVGRTILNDSTDKRPG